ncbi:MAG TPA: branched-chain amino acid ABC transporter permease [Anaerolineales bacterium]|jgi:branched-chain amino acid transport system permease protein|nr:branched-chain amino acid ABC transporter permease [Anaerolineales bacterium]
MSVQRWLPQAGMILLILFAIVYPRQVDKQNTWNLFFLICLGISLGQSWNILAGFAGQSSLGHAAFFGIGALVTRILWFNGTPFALAFLTGGLAAVAFAMLIGAPTFRLRGAYFAIGTLGVAEVLRITVSQTMPLISTMSGTLIATYDLPARYYLALGLAIATTGAAYLLLRSPWSLGILAVREDEGAAQATGVHVLRHKLLALSLSSFFAGLAGGVFAFQQISYYPAAPFSPLWTFDALLITFIGGLGTLAGPVIGSIFFILVRQQLAVTLVEIHQVVFGILFIIIVLVFPGGLVEAWRRLHGIRWPKRRS